VWDPPPFPAMAFAKGEPRAGVGSVNRHPTQSRPPAPRFLVLDEADRLLDPTFEAPLRTILAALPAEDRQTLLFSATMTQVGGGPRASLLRPRLSRGCQPLLSCLNDALLC
jgi:hypothetical protein